MRVQDISAPLPTAYARQGWLGWSALAALLAGTVVLVLPYTVAQSMLFGLACQVVMY